MLIKPIDDWFMGKKWLPGTSNWAVTEAVFGILLGALAVQLMAKALDAMGVVAAIAH